MKRETTKRIIAIACVIGIAGLALFSIACVHQYNLARDGLANGFDPNGQFTIRLAKGSFEDYSGPSHFICFGDPEEEGGQGFNYSLMEIDGEGHEDYTSLGTAVAGSVPNLYYLYPLDYSYPLGGSPEETEPSGEFYVLYNHMGFDGHEGAVYIRFEGKEAVLYR